MLSEQVIQTVKSTIPLLEQGGVAITEHFYNRLFNHHPELLNIFNKTNQATGRQKTALFNAIAAYAKNIDNLGALKAAVERIAHKHTSLDVQAEHYDVVGQHLIATLKEFYGDVFAPEIEAAWIEAYGQLADVFIGREGEIYQHNQTQPGGWTGARAFNVSAVTQASEWVKSFEFVPADGGAVIDYLPGQYIGIRVKGENFSHQQIRQYSLSRAADGRTYQISVKREIGEHPGLVSNYLHDNLQLGSRVELFAPAGDFYFVDRQAPVVLISAGVGLTPMQAMLETLAQHSYDQPVTYLHACETIAQHSFKERVQGLQNQLNLNAITWYGNEPSNNHNGRTGYMDLSPEASQLPLTNGDFYLCGPVPFMRFVKMQLLELGVANDRIHYEVFGPHDDF